MTIGIMGLGRMGAQIARRLHKNNFQVIAWNRSPEPRQKFINFGGQARETIEEVLHDLQSPKIIWLMLPSGELVDEFIDKVSGKLSKGDIVIDGGNSFYRDSIKRAEKLKALGIHFFDSGTSGGVWGEQNGFSLMVGGDSEIFPQIEPIFKTLAAGEGKNYGLVGANGAGHLVKMVHNGIEYGMMEAIAEGFGILKASEFGDKLNFSQVSQIWSRGSVVTSWLVELAKNIFDTENIDNVVGLIEHTGEGEWTIKVAKELGVDVRVIEDAFRVRQESLDPKNQEKISNKIVSLLRKQFGGHGVTYKK